MERHRIGIVIPAFNEAKTIGLIVSGAAQYGLPIVVDDGSTDETGTVAVIAGATVIRATINLGYDHALNLGFAHAEEFGCEYILTMDADGQHDPAILKLFIQALDEGADVVIGTRDRRQRLAEHMFALVASPKWGIRDPLCGIKAYRINTYMELGYFDSYGSIGTELVIHAAESGKNIVQIDVMTRDRIDASRFGWRYSANKKILRALWLGIFPRARKSVSPPA
jgi:glycosyltransferase involved in cell wall biosynthesis